MRTYGLAAYAAGAGMALALLTDCAGGSAGLNPATPADHSTSWMRPDAKSHDLLYVTTSMGVFVYSYPGGTFEGQLTVSKPAGDCTDKKGNIYITSFADGSVFEYAHGGTEPLRVLPAPVPGTAPASCAVDPTSGDLAVTEEGRENGVGAGVMIYPKAVGAPKIYMGGDLVNYEYCTYDNTGNLFVDGTYPHGYENGLLAELPRGGTSLRTVNLNYTLGWLSGVQWDGKYLAVGQAVTPRIFRYTISGGNGFFVSSTALTGAYDGFQFIFAGKNLILSNTYYDGYLERWDVLVFAFPEGAEKTELGPFDDYEASVALSR